MTRYSQRYAGAGGGGGGGGIEEIDDTNTPDWVPAYLVYDAVETNYMPADARGLDRPKVFIGPTDPDGLTGVVLNAYDQWRETAA